MQAPFLAFDVAVRYNRSWADTAHDRTRPNDVTSLSVSLPT